MQSAHSPVWYVAFGSNLLGTRLRAYLEGTAVPGSSQRFVEQGARDPSPPRADESMLLRHELYFAGNSNRWGGGGVAFVDPRPSEAQTLARRYLISWDQLEDIHRQENRSATIEPASETDLEKLGALKLYGGSYETLLWCGRHIDGAPMVTITSGIRRPANPPSVDYLEVIGRGLTELGHNADEISAYLSAHRASDRDGAVE